MSEAAALEFMTSLQSQFRVKRHESEDHEAKWIAMNIAELKGYSPEVLQQAAKNLIRKRRNEYFPVLSECLAACEDAKHWIDAAQPKMKFGGAAKSHPSSADRQRLADELVMGEMGRQAASEGWILTLHDFVRDNGRLPDQRQAPKLKATAKGFDEALNQCRVGGFMLSAQLRDLGTSMLARRQALTDMVLHGVVR